MSNINVAILGACGWMGRVHTSGYLSLSRQFPEVKAKANVCLLVDMADSQLQEIGASIGCSNLSSDWREAINDPRVDLVDICLPDKEHYPVAKAALEAGKHVYCEKPMTDTFEQAVELAEIARMKGVVTRVGYSFLVNPAHRLARTLVMRGDIGEVTYFRGSQHVDTHGSPESPFIWRLDGELARTGIVGDTGSHVFSMVDFMVGPVRRLFAHCPIILDKRPDGPGVSYGDAVSVSEGAFLKKVTNPDMGLMICEFENGAIGFTEFSRIATGKKFEQRYDIFGTKGSISFNYDEPFRLRVYTEDRSGGGVGYKTIDMGPDKPEYGSYLPLPNFSLGFNEVKMYEVREVIESVASGKETYPTFADGTRIVSLTDACLRSHETNRWEMVETWA